MSWPHNGAGTIWSDGIDLEKSNIRDWGRNVQDRVEVLEAGATGGARYTSDTLADLNAVPSPASGDSAYVLDDGANTGTWNHDGASWSRVAGLPAGMADGVAATQALRAELSDVDNTADADKPISAAQQAALDLKADVDAISTSTLGNGTVYRMDAADALSTTTSGDPSGRPSYAGGEIVSIPGWGRALAVSGTDIAVSGTDIDLALKVIWPIEPDRLYRMRLAYARVTDPVDPSGDAVRLRLGKLNASKVQTDTTILHTHEDLTVADGVQVLSVTLSKDAALKPDQSIDAATAYVQAVFKAYGLEPDHQVAWIVATFEDVTDFLLPDDRDHLMSDAERADIAADKARIGVLEAQQRHRIIPRPLTGESGIAVYDRDGQSVAFPQYRIEEYKEAGYAPTFSVDGGTFTYAGGNDTSVLAIDLDTHDWVETDLDTASDLTRYLTVFEMSPSGISAARGLPIVEKENTDTTELITSYDPAMDVILTQPQTTVEQYEPRFVHTEAGKFWFAPAARQGQKIILRQGAVFDLTSVPMGVTVEFHCSAAAALYAGLSHVDESQIGFDDMDDGGDPALPLNYATLTAGQWGFISRPEPGVIKLAWMDRDAPPVFTNIDHPIADLHIMGTGQSPLIELRNKGGLCGLQRGLVAGFRMTNPADGEPQPFTGTFYYSSAGLGGSCADSRNTSGDGYYRNGKTGAFDGAAAIEFRRVADLAHARGQPCPSLIEPWWGAADITGMVALDPDPDNPPTDIAQLRATMIACFEDKRNYVASKPGWNDLPVVALSTVQLNEKGLGSDASVAATRDDVTTRVRAMQLELINDPDLPWIVQGVSNWSFRRRPGQAHHTYDGNDQWGFVKAPSIGNLCLGQQNDVQSSLESYEIAEDRGSVTFTFTEPLGQKFRTPSGIGGGHYSTAPAPFLIGILNAARQIIPARVAKWISDRSVQIWVDLPVEGVKTSAIFPYGADQRTAMGLDYPHTIVSRGGEFDPASGLYHIAARDFFIGEI